MFDDYNKPKGPRPTTEPQPQPKVHKNCCCEQTKPFICPVCEGRGNVSYNFYGDKEPTYFCISELCRSCNGNGIIWREG